MFEKNFDLPRQRRMFVEQEVAGKNPNLGYAYLVRLIEEGFLNTVFTTNFDDLINEAFFQFSQTRPVVCAHDSSISSVAVTSKRPKVIKLHGDYLFDDIKATVRETESLEDNTRRKFIEFCRDFGLIVVGYGGYDRSIMDVLQYLLRSDDYFKHGIYWCLRKEDQPSDELLKLLWRDRVYFVEIDGFDELMASLHHDLVGQALPIDSGVVTNKPKTIIKGFCENSFLRNSRSTIIKRDLERLSKQSEREELFSVLRDAKDETADREKQSIESLTERELVIVFEIKQALGVGDFDIARTRIGAELQTKPSKKLKEELSALRVRVEELAGDFPAAVAAVDSLILEDPQEPENYIRKTFLATDHGERIKVLAVAKEIDSENYRVYGRIVDCYIDAYEAGTIGDRAEMFRSIEENIERSLSLEPSLRNPTWRTATDFYASCSLPKDDIKAKLDKLIERCSALGSKRTVTLRARLRRWSKYKDDRSSEEADQLLSDISAARLASSKSLKPYYEWLELDAYRQLGRKEELSRRLSELALIPDLADTREYLRRKADFLVKFNGDIHAAIGALKQAVIIEPSRSDILRLSSLLEIVGDAAGIAELAASHALRLPLIDRIILRREEFSARGDHESALAQLRSTYSKRLVGAAEKLAEIHDLLLLTRYGEAASICKNLLDGLGWNKIDFGEHIVNYELAQVRLGESFNKKRLSELADVTRSDQVKACAQYLIGDHSKARETLVSSMREDREDRFVIPRWAIFQDDRGKAFIDGVVKALG